ncbi:glycosyltransferase family 39 protein [archaeon]|nr:glycosyltransferase family 39 protein [archaeon]
MAENQATQDILNRLRPTRLQAIEIGILAAIAIVTALLRILPLQYGAYFTAFDPLFQYRATQYVVENGFASWWSWHDTMSWYPMGRNVANSAYPGVPFAAAFLYLVQKTLGFGISLYNVCLYFPVFMAVVTIITIYYLGKELRGRPTGIFAALFLAITPAFIARTSLGFFDTENIGIFAIVATSLFFLRSSDKERSIEQRVIYGVLSGLTLGLIYASWGAAKYMTGMLMLYMGFLVITEKYEIRHLITYTITIGLGFLIVFFTPRLGPMSVLSLDSVLAFMVILGLIGYEFIKDKIDISVVSVAALGLLVLVVLGIFILPAVGIDIPIGFKFLKVLNPFTSTDSYLYDSVAENHTAPWASLFNNYGIILMLGVFGTYLSIKELDEKNLYAVLFFLTSLYFAGVMSRLTQILTAPASLIGGYGLVRAVSPFLYEQTPASSRTARRRKQVYGVSKPLVLVFVGFLLVSMIPNVYSAIESADSPNQLASSGISVKVNGEYPQDWPEALEWMKKNMTDDSVVCSWWDYGYWIEAMAGKTTMADGATQTTRQIANIGQILMNPPNVSIGMLERYGADYVVVFTSYSEQYGQSLYAGDEVKWQWMVQIGGLDLNDYVNYTAGVYKEGFIQSTLYNLMFEGNTGGLFDLVYKSENGFVLIYEVKYQE